MEYRLPPGLKHPLPFYLGKPWLKLGHPIPLFEHLQRTFGDIAHYRFLGTSIIFINRPEYIQEILINQASSFVKERTVRRMKVLLGEGLLTSDGPQHDRNRKLAAPAFHRQRISAYADTIAGIAERACAGWQEGQTIDIAAEMMKMALEIVARTLFDTEVTEQVRSINDEVNTIMELYNFIVAMPRLESYLHWPLPGLVKFRRSRDRLNAVVDSMVRTRRQEIAAAGVDGRVDVLSMLLASRFESERAGSGGEGLAMTDQQVRDEVLTIFLAGYETVANALTWTWYCLSQNAEAESQLHAELQSVLAGRAPALGNYPALRYTEQVFAEAMRLYPPAWAMGRMSTQPVTLGPYRIPAGAHFFFSQYIMHRTPEYFPDPLRFDPARHLPAAKQTRPRFSYFPFGGGGRQCIGEAFAWMEGVMSIAAIASRWTLRYAGAAAPSLQAKITLRPQGAMPMRVVGRLRMPGSA